MEDKRISFVQLEGLVLLQVIKHCRQNAPNVVTGQLLGLDIDDRLEVTNSFPHVEGEEADDHQWAMMKCLQKVNVDSDTVGWYKSAFLSNFVNKDAISEQYEYQKELPNSIMLIYDPYLTSSGRLALKAYRLTSEFMALYESNEGFGQTRFTEANVSASDIFEEIPLKVHNSHLVHAFLFELREHKSMSCDFDRLSLNLSSELVSGFQQLSSSIDKYENEQYTYWNDQRKRQRQKVSQDQFLQDRRERNQALVLAGKEEVPELTPEELKKFEIFREIPEVDRLETYLISHQMKHYCDQMTATATQGFNKLFVTQAFHRD